MMQRTFSPIARLGCMRYCLMVFFILITYAANGYAQNPLLAPSHLQVEETYPVDTTWKNFNLGIEFYLHWDSNSPSITTSFILERALDGGSFEVMQTIKSSGVSIGEAIERMLPGSAYTYRVKACTVDACSPYSDPVGPFTAMLQPLYFSVASYESTKAWIFFYDRTYGTPDPALGFKIERSDNGGPYHAIVDQAPSAYALQSAFYNRSMDQKYKYFIDASVTPGAAYRYRVFGYDAHGNSPLAYPDVIYVSPGGAPLAPGVSAYLSQAKSSSGAAIPAIRIDVSDQSNNEARFIIERSSDQKSWVNLCTLTWYSSDKYCLDKALTAGATYYYRVHAENDTAKSPYALSNPIGAPGIPPSGITQWYVWRGASGNNDGSSWKNGWRDIDQINWSVIKPGDTLFLSGDSYGKPFVIAAKGTQAQPLVIRPGLAASDSSGHDGRVVVTSITFNSTLPAEWITIDGSRNPTFFPTSALSVDSNINFEVSDSPGDGIFHSQGRGITLKYLAIVRTKGGGVRFNGGPQENLLLYGLHLDRIGGNGIQFNDGHAANPAFETIQLRKSLIEHVGSDCVDGAGNLTIADNIIRYNDVLTGGHADAIQLMNSMYLDVHGNEIYDRTTNAFLLAVHAASNRIPAIGHIRIYNNVFYYSNPALSPSGEGIMLQAMNESVPGRPYIPVQYWEDILIANNTFYNLWLQHSFSVDVHTTDVGQVSINGLVYKNNLSYLFDTTRLLTNQDVQLVLSKSNSLVNYGTPSTLSVSNNIVAGANTTVAYGGSSYATLEAFDSATGFTADSSRPPSFVDAATANFHLASGDIAATNKGANLSGYFSIDKDGRARPATGAWDIGAYRSGVPKATDWPPVRPGNLRIH